MSRIPSWELFQTFLAVIRTGSLSAAARDLRITQPTARRRIEELEGQLKARLFVRRPNGLAPTEGAIAAYPMALQLEAAAQALVRAAAGGEALSGPVKVTASEVMATYVLPGRMAGFLRRNPNLTLELAATNQLDDVLRQHADIAVRMVRPSQTSLVARKVGEVTVGLFASDDYLGQAGPISLQSLKTQCFVGQETSSDQAEGLASVGIDASDLRYGFRSGSDAAQLFAIQAGIGIGFCHAGELANSLGLRRVLPELGVRLEIWIATNADLTGHRRIRAVVDELTAVLRDYGGR